MLQVLGGLVLLALYAWDRSRLKRALMAKAGGPLRAAEAQRLSDQLARGEPHCLAQSNSRPGQQQRKFSREDYDVLPLRIIMFRHAQSQGNVEKKTYCTQPDHTVPLTEQGVRQAREAGQQMHSMLRLLHSDSGDFRLFFLTSPYCRTLQTTDMLMEAFTDDQIAGVRAAVQLREQDFGNFQDPLRISQDLSDRLRFGRFWFRFPNGESGADVYDRLALFEDHLSREMLTGRFADCSLVLVTHGLSMRIFLMHWFGWSVDDFLGVWNPGNCDPVLLEKLPWERIQELQGVCRYTTVRQCYAISAESIAKLTGCTPEMASYQAQIMASPKGGERHRWKSRRVYAAAAKKPCPQTGGTTTVQATAVGGPAAPPPCNRAGAPKYAVVSAEEAADWWRGDEARFRVDNS